MNPALTELHHAARAQLLAARTPDGHWEGHLSSSALATATALTALALLQKTTNQDESIRIINAAHWLTATQNPDGGWGDTTDSPSNISTTTLCWAALALTPETNSDAALRAAEWLTSHAGDTSPDRLATAIRHRYGTDHTFAVPILTLTTLSGRWPESAWQTIPQLPFELAILPRFTFSLLRMPVVSYALPALIAMGLARHAHLPTRSPWRLIRSATANAALRVLDTICPSSGGFLEAIPLTSFVLMSLLAAGEGGRVRHDLPIIPRLADFLRRAQRPDGSWPIDTNLATWLTTLSINALGPGTDHHPNLLPWLLNQQTRTTHPYTGAAPGAWAWTDLPGGVPDADDTASALLALQTLDNPNMPPDAIEAAARWLARAQNTDGGIPTFCRGWGHLDFDRSSPDITAHAIRALEAWPDALHPRRHDRFLRRAHHFLTQAQQPDGPWIPLWFGNQYASDQANRIYGTARVLRALPPSSQPYQRGLSFLLHHQNPDGSFGQSAPSGATGTGTIEETALALTVLSPTQHPLPTTRALQWLLDRTDHGRHWPTAPLGLYFARLWYHEDLYPLIFTLEALRRQSAT